jgi:acyl carrier protein
MMHRIDEIVVDLIAKNKGLDPADVVPESDLAGLGITSLEAITLAYELEEALGVEIPNADIESLRTVQDLIDGLNRLIAAKG